MKTIRRNTHKFQWVLEQDFAATYFSSIRPHGEPSSKPEVLKEMQNWNCWKLKEEIPLKVYRFEFPTCAYYRMEII